MPAPAPFPAKENPKAKKSSLLTWKLIATHKSIASQMYLYGTTWCGRYYEIRLAVPTYGQPTRFLAYRRTTDPISYNEHVQDLGVLKVKGVESLAQAQHVGFKWAEEKIVTPLEALGTLAKKSRRNPLLKWQKWGGRLRPTYRVEHRGVFYQVFATPFVVEPGEKPSYIVALHSGGHFGSYPKWVRSYRTTKKQNFRDWAEQYILSDLERLAAVPTMKKNPRRKTLLVWKRQRSVPFVQVYKAHQTGRPDRTYTLRIRPFGDGRTSLHVYKNFHSTVNQYQEIHVAEGVLRPILPPGWSKTREKDVIFKWAEDQLLSPLEQLTLATRDQKK